MNAKIGYVLIAIAAITLASCFGVAYAYQATYTEDPTQGTDVNPTYITLTKMSGNDAPDGISFAFSTQNWTAGSDDIVIDVSQPITVATTDVASPISFVQEGESWVALDDDSKRKYVLETGTETQAQAIFLLGTYTVTHNGSDLQITVTPSKATGEDQQGIVTLLISTTDDYGGADSCTVSTGATVYLYAHVDVSAAFDTEAYGDIQIPSVTPTITAVPAEP